MEIAAKIMLNLNQTLPFPNVFIFSLADLDNSENHKRFSMKRVLLFEASAGKIMNN